MLRRQCADQLTTERRNIIRLPAADQVAVFDHFLIDPVGAGIHQIILECLVAGHGFAIHQPRRNQQPAAMADHRNRITGRGACLDQVLGILVDADGVRILYATG